LLCSLLLTAPPAYAEPVATQPEMKLEELLALMGKLGMDVSSKTMAEVRLRASMDVEATYSIAKRMLKSDLIKDTERAVYIWALGLTGKPTAVKLIIEQARADAPIIIKANIDNALAELGGRQAGRFLLDSFEEAKSDEYRLYLLRLMGRMKYKPAINKSMIALELNLRDSDFKAIYFYGAMGEASVPFLMDKLNHKSALVRQNAASILGQWIASPKALGPLTKQLAVERDTKVRKAILESIEFLTSDLDALEEFYLNVLDKEKDPELRHFLKQGIEDLPRLKRATRKKYEARIADLSAYIESFNRLLATRGRTGNYALLARTSSADNEPDLRHLRERFLSRIDDKAILDFQRITSIILTNRLIRSEGLEQSTAK